MYVCLFVLGFQYFSHMRVVPEVRRQSLKCFKMISYIDIILLVNTYACVFHIVNIHKQYS